MRIYNKKTETYISDPSEIETARKKLGDALFEKYPYEEWEFTFNGVFCRGQYLDTLILEADEYVTTDLRLLTVLTIAERMEQKIRNEKAAR